MRSPVSSRFSSPAALLLACLLVGCGQQPGPPGASPATASDLPASATSSAPAGSTRTPGPGETKGPEATAGSGPSAAWTTYTTADAQLTFDLPAAWRVEDPAGELPEGGGAFAEITNPAGKPLATLRTNMATGSTCTDRYPYSVLDSQDMTALTLKGATPRFVFETRGTATVPGPADTPAAAYGITSGPPPSGDSACAIFHFFTWPPTAAMFGAFYSPANNETPGDAALPYLEKAKMYTETAEYRDIRRMITSLRPAG
ncbi:hypothetical protein [Arthrobacter oryzae]|uniref:hypothetical protein n=1 Tax=Arthrobacter oryzae TaxID=409290 RepID=UPI00286331E2|nr:hypothetical protein [Arthrobacter oryzae]MDR6507977.1 hypothetical protein [Arthrobacter oryzae]